MSDKTHQEADGSPQKRFSPVVLALALLVLYPLSIGPMVMLVDRVGLDLAATLTFFGVLYFPIIWLADRLPWFATLFGWYLKVFTGQS